MPNDEKSGMNTAADFSYGLRELRAAASRLMNTGPGAAANAAAPAKRPQAPPAAHHPQRRPRIKFTLEDTPVEKAGFDPYNTSGSFDRSKNWSRVSKR